MTRPFNPYEVHLRTEPDMRQEMINTLQGNYPEIAKKQTHVLRKMRTGTLEVWPEDDSVGDGWVEHVAAGTHYRWKVGIGNDLLPCPCVDALTHEPDKDTFCPVCFGEGFVWDEFLVEGYKVVIRSSVGLSSKETLIAPGLTNLSYASFYFDYELPLNLFPKRTSPDKIVEITTDETGKPVRPYQRDTIYRIGTAIDFRSDSGKLEYWKVDCYEEQVKFLNGSQG